MTLLELFAGSRSMGKAAESLGVKVFSSDIVAYDNIDYVTDILNFDVSVVPFIPDIIWASPPCTFFSVASIGKHWHKDNTPKTNNAELGVSIVQKLIEIIDYYKSINPNMKYFIENPRGKLRKLELTRYFDIKHTISYCKYGDDRMKPTDIWTNTMLWYPRPMCGNGRFCHEAAPRGSKTGTQGKSNAYERSKVPNELCIEILKSCMQ